MIHLGCLLSLSRTYTTPNLVPCKATLTMASPPSRNNAMEFSLTDAATADILLKAVQFLNVNDSGRLAATSQRMYYLVHQYRRLRLTERPDLLVVSTRSKNGSTVPISTMVLRARDRMRTKPNLVMSFGRDARGGDPHFWQNLLQEYLMDDGSSIVHCGVQSQCIQVNSAAQPDGPSVSWEDDAALMAASFSDASILPFCLGEDRDDGLEKICQKMKDMEEKDKVDKTAKQESPNEDQDGKPAANTMATTTIAGSKRKAGENEIPTKPFWKAMIVYSCGHVTSSEVEKTIHTIQSANPDVAIVGGICRRGFVSFGKGKASFQSSYSKEDLMDKKISELKKLAKMHPDIEDDDDEEEIFDGFLEKSDLVDFVFERIRKFREDKKNNITTVRNGVFGVLLGGNVPVRSMVSRGVKSILNDGSKDVTRWMVQDIECFKPTDEHFPAPLERFGLPDHWKLHFIESVKNLETGQILPASQVLNMPAVSDADFIGVRTTEDSIEDGFELCQWNGQLSQMMDKIVVIDQKQGSSSPKPIEIGFFELDGDACRNDMEQAAKTLKEQTSRAKEDVLGALMFSCSGRGPVNNFMGLMADATLFSKSFPRVPCLGFYAGGEIGPQARAGRNGHNVFRTGSAAVQGVS